MSLRCLNVSAHSFEAQNADGVTIYYQYRGTDELFVTYRGEDCDSYDNEYSGNVIIPESVEYNGKVYSVTGIGSSAFENCIGLTSVTVPNSVTYIGERAFYGCASLIDMAIPNSLYTINNYTFYGCSSIESIIIPNSVSEIGSYAFMYCVNLRTVSMPESLYSIGIYSFYGCTSLENLFIPANVSTISYGAFWECSGLASITVDGSNNKFDSRDNCNAIIETSTNKLLYGCKNTVIPNSITVIGASSFRGCIGLTTINIPDGIISIEGAAFLGCSGLTSLYIPSSVKYLGSAFKGCIGVSSIIVDEGNTTYDSRENCNAIIATETNRMIVACNNTTVPLSVQSFSDDAFSNCVSVSLPDGLETMPKFRGCDYLNYVRIPGSIKVIEEYTFDNCPRLETIVFEDGMETLTFKPITDYSNNDSRLYWIRDCPIDSIYVGRNISYEFKNHYNQEVCISPWKDSQTLRAVKFGHHSTILQGGFFSGCSSLATVELPEYMEEIGGSAFANCISLTKVHVPQGVKRIEWGTFSHCTSLSEVVLPESMEYIGHVSFEYCENIESVVIPSAVKRIDNGAFSYCSKLTHLRIEDSDEILSFNEPNLISAFLLCPLTNIYLGRNASSRYTFRSITTPFDLTIGDKVTSLYGTLFAECNKIKSVVFEDGTDTLTLSRQYLTTTYSSIPFQDSSVDSVYLGRVIVSNGAFGCVKEPFILTIGNNISELGENACSSWKISSVTIPNTISKLGTNAFGYCNMLTSVAIEDGDEVLNCDEGNNFRGSPIDSLYIGRTLSYNTSSPFKYNKEGLKTLVIGGKVKEIGESMFEGFSSLTSVELPDGIEKIGPYAFYGCGGLTELSIPGSVAEIGENAFKVCGGIKKVVIADGSNVLRFTTKSPNSINNSFLDSPLEKLYLGRNISYNIASPFSMLSTLKEITIGPKVSYIENKAFISLDNLKDVFSYSETIPSTGELVFTPAYLPQATLHVPYALYDEYKVTVPWKDFGNIVNFEGLYNLIYMLDGEVYKKIVVEEGSEIVVEEAPILEGYTFSGWSEIPETMPAHDVIVTGFLTPNNYKLTYLVDGNEYKTIEVEYMATIDPEPTPVKEGHTFSGWVGLPETMPAHDVTVTGTFSVNTYTLTYIVDGELYASYEKQYGENVTAEPAPSKEGYTFSGWSDIPETMPAHDVTVTGSFTLNKYILTYLVDGIEYKSYEVEYLMTITPEPAPEKEGFTFSGWSEIPETMPAHDVTVTGTFSVNTYTLTYIVDGEVYASYEKQYGESVTPEPAPSKEGYTFSGWSDIPETMPAHDVTVTGSFTLNKYILTYLVDGIEYKSYEVEYLMTITPEPAPEKEGFTFSGWSEIPETMPAHDVTVTGTFSVNTYTLTYIVDGELYASYEKQYGESVTAEPAPEKEGYSFSGWNDIPETMPAHDVTVTGTFSVNTYTLTYIVDGELYASYEKQYGESVTPEPAPSREGYTFSGWSAIPATMPARDVTVTGTFSINSYVLTYMIDETVYKTVEYEYGATITPEPIPEGNYVTFEWVGEPETMPAHDVIVHASYETSIADLVVLARMGAVRIFTPNGKQIDCPQKGLNIIVMQNGKVKKVVVK